MAKCILRIECSLAKEGIFLIKKVVETEFTAKSDDDARSKATVIWQEETTKLKKEGRITEKKSVLYKQILFP